MKHNYRFDVLRLYHKFPLSRAIIKQVIFWVVAYGVLGSILYFSTLSNYVALNRNFEGNFSLVMFTVILIGSVFGIILGSLEYFVNKRFYLNRSLGVLLLLGGFIYYLLIMGLISATKYFLFGIQKLLNIDMTLMGLTLEDNWKYYYAILLIYTLFMTLVMSFINQMEKKFGPGYLLPILMGKFRYPREEERIFMFLDLSSSTALAETLGHLTYSRLIRESFQDINRIVKNYDAEIYQYVGDEVVISWPFEAQKSFTAINFFFAVQDFFLSRKEFYLKEFGVIPSFKAGAHVGTVTVVEVGEVKRDIAYHGDTLNVTARLESLCNELYQPILISAALKETGRLDKIYNTNSFGLINLKGRKEQLEVFGISRKINIDVKSIYSNGTYV